MFEVEDEIRKLILGASLWKCKVSSPVSAYRLILGLVRKAPITR